MNNNVNEKEFQRNPLGTHLELKGGDVVYEAHRGCRTIFYSSVNNEVTEVKYKGGRIEKVKKLSK